MLIIYAVYNMNNLLILYKVSNIENEIYKITKSYCNSFQNVSSYFVICDNAIDDDIILLENEHIVKVKMINDNWECILIRVIKTMIIFRNKYTHYMFASISTFINIPVIYNYLSTDINCMAFTGQHIYKNITFNFPSGAGYIFNNAFVCHICDWFNQNAYIVNNKLTDNFKKTYPTTDDLFFGYYMYINQIHIYPIDRMNIHNYPFNKSQIQNISHFRIRSDQIEIIHHELYECIYAEQFNKIT